MPSCQAKRGNWNDWDKEDAVVVVSSEEAVNFKLLAIKI